MSRQHLTTEEAAAPRNLIPPKRVTGVRDGAFIYFVRCGGSGGPVKIGFAADVSRRLPVIQNGCPYPVTLEAYFWAGRKALECEAKLHAMFADSRLYGEWFSSSPLLEDFIAAIYDAFKAGHSSGVPEALLA